MVEKMSFVERMVAELINNTVCSVAESKNIIKTFEESSFEHFDMFLLEEELVSKEKLLKILSQVYEIPAFDVAGYFFDHELLLLFPKEFLMENFFIPLRIDDESLIIVMSNPEDMDTLETIGNYVSYNIETQIGLSENIIEAIEEYYNLNIVSNSVEGVEDDEIEDDGEILRDGMEEFQGPIDTDETEFLDFL